MIDPTYDVSVLVVDDDEAMRYGLARELKKCGCTVTESESVEDALGQLSTAEYQLVFCDMRFPGGAGGDELLTNVRDQFPNTSFVMVSCAMDNDRKQQLLLAGASFCIQKPIFKDQCITLLSSLGGETSLANAA